MKPGLEIPCNYKLAASYMFLESYQWPALIYVMFLSNLLTALLDYLVPCYVHVLFA